MIFDKYLEEAAKAMNGESNVVPSHLVVATDVNVIDPTMTSFTGEVVTRPAFTNTRLGRTITRNAIFSGASVPSGGITYRAAGSKPASSGGDLMTGVVYPGLTQTTDFDLEFLFEESFRRRT